MKLTDKFSHTKYLDNIKRFRGIEKTRFNKIRLDANERVSNFSEKFLLNFKRKINSNYLTAYPETEQIYKLLAKNFGMNPKNYFITAGSDIAIRHCFELFVKKGSNIICLDPTFGMYNVYSKIFRAKVTNVSFDSKLNLNYSKMINSINKKTSFIIFANPNSPTGTIIESKKIFKIIQKAKKNNCYVIIDEAYFGFYKKSYIKYIKKYNNLIIIRTFSKSLGLAGIRAGYLVSNEKLIEKLYKFRPMYEINSFAVLLIKEILKNKKEYTNYIKDTIKGKKYLEKQLLKLKLRYYKTFANFILIDFKKPDIQRKVFSYLNSKNILVRLPPEILACKNHLRFTLGPEKYMKIVIGILKGIIRQ